MTVIRIIIEGNPTAWAAPCVMRRGISYNPKSKEKTSARAQVLHQYRSEPLTGPISASIWFLMPIPMSTSKKARESMLEGEIKHTKKPDADNMIKFALDCVKGIVIKDDNQVFTIFAKKMYSEEPKTIIEIQEHR